MEENKLPNYETLNLTQKEDTLVVKLHRPDKFNAVNSQMLKDLISLADWLRENNEIKYVIFTNEGKFFSVGADLFEVGEDLRNEEEAANDYRVLQIIGQEAIRKLENLEQITIAAIKGSAYGAGVAIATVTDFRYMVKDSVLNLPETNVGLFLTWGCTARLVNAVGALKAKELIMLCEDVTAEEALSAGLINEVCENSNSMDNEVDQLIEKLRGKGQHSIRLTKKLIHSSLSLNIGDIHLTEPELVGKVISVGETREKVEQFIQQKGK